MLRKRYIYILMVLLVQTVVTDAQVRKNVQHRLRVTASAGYSWDGELKNAQEESKLVGSFGVKPMLGFGYRMEYGHLLVDAGLDVGYRYVNDKMAPVSNTEAQDFGDGLVWGVTTEQNDRHLHCQQFSVGVPVAVGFKAGYVYGSIGAKLGVGLPNTDKISYLYTETRDNERLANPIVYFHDDERHYNVEDGLGIEVLVTAELGARLDKIDSYRGYYKDRSPLHHYLGVFAEVNAYSNAPAIEEMKRMPVTVGVKYTLEIELKAKHRCTTCLGD